MRLLPSSEEIRFLESMGIDLPKPQRAPQLRRPGRKQHVFWPVLLVSLPVIAVGLLAWWN